MFCFWIHYAMEATRSVIKLMMWYSWVSCFMFLELEFNPGIFYSMKRINLCLSSSLYIDYWMQNEFIIHKFSQKSRDEKSFSNADGSSGRNKSGRSKSTASKRVGVQKKGNQGILVDSEEQRVHWSYSMMLAGLFIFESSWCFE